MLALLVLVGCDDVLGINQFPSVTSLCGPYGPPTVVQFDPALQHPNDFSVGSDLIHGLVTANVGGVTGPTPIVFDDGSATWKVDTRPNVQKVLPMISGAHMGVNTAMTGNDDVYGWSLHDIIAQPEIRRYMYNGSQWVADAAFLAESTTQDLMTGNEVETDAGGGLVSRYLVEILAPKDGVGRNSIDVLVATPGSGNFVTSGFVGPINTDPAMFDPRGGALTGDHERLVYATSVGDSTEVHLYEAALAREQFQPGNPISSLDAPGVSDDQPWINADCSTIWFRRNGMTLTAQRE